MALDQIDLANSPKPLNYYIGKRIKDGRVTLRLELKNATCLNCSGDNATQKSKPTKNGTSSKNYASSAQQLHQTLLQKEEGKEKEKKATTAPSNPNPPAPSKQKSKKPKKRDKGSHGGSKDGGKPKGAAGAKG